MQRKILLSIVFMTLIVAYFGWLDHPGLRAEEPRRALVSIEMMKSGNLIVPQLLGWPYYNKPPLFQWVMIVLFRIFGNIQEWVVRLPSTLALFAIALLNWKIVRCYLPERVALLSSLFLLTSVDILYYGSVNTGEIDLFYSLLVYLQIILIYHFLEKKQFLGMFLLSYFFAALGFLTKGPPSIAFQGLTLVLGLIYFRAWRRLFHWQHFSGILVFIVVAGGYLLLLEERGELAGFIIRQVKESSQRTAIDSASTGTLRGILLNPLDLFIKLLPWSLWMLAFLSKHIRKQVMSHRLVVFVLLFTVVNFPIYWISGELRIRYVYPFFPFLCIVIADLFNSTYHRFVKIRNAWDIFIGCLIAVFPLALTAAYFIPSIELRSTRLWIHIFLIATGVGLLIYYIKAKQFRIWILIVFLGLTRITMNNIYLPIYEKDSRTAVLRSHVENMIELASGEPIAIAGSPYVYNSTIEVFGRKFLTGEVASPLILSYQIPYYYVLETGIVLHHIREPRAGSLYLIADAERERLPGQVLYTFKDLASQNVLHLIRLDPY